MIASEGSPALLVHYVRDVSKNPGAGVAAEDAMLEAAAQTGRPQLRLWYNTPCIVLGRGYARKLPRQVERVVNLPVLVRSSGGQVVIHGPGVLNVSLAVPTAIWDGSIHDAFSGLSQPVANALWALGWSATIGEIPGSYCPGDHDVAVGGRKVMGISQRRTRGAILVHGSVNVSIVPSIYTYLLQRFYEAAGIDERPDVDLIGTLMSRPCDHESASAIEGAMAQAILGFWTQATGLTWTTE